MMRGDRVIFVILIASFALTALLVFYPAFHAVELSFQQRASLVSAPKWVGLDNYVQVLRLPEFWSALGRGVIFAACSIALQVGLGLGIAILLDRKVPGVALIRGLSVLPYLLPTVVVALTFRWILDGSTGILTHLAQQLGYGNFAWADDPVSALATVVFVSVWTWTPFVTLSCLAGMQSIPEELYEAARIDGAGAWHRFLHVTLPQLRSVILVVILLRTIWMFNKFDIVWLMTNGGPDHATEHLPILSYRLAFELYDVGKGAAISTISFLILSVLIVIYFRIFPMDQKD
jgi:multiple sugar transport system permease protein